MSASFIDLCLRLGVLRFGEFKLKSGRLSPYFFNAGSFNTGGGLAELGRHYADAIHKTAWSFDVLFGPAYKGIPLVAAASIALADRHGRDVPWAFNRKEAKDHREAVDIITAAGAQPVGVVLALDRQERGTGQLSAVQEVEQTLGLPVTSILKLADLVDYLERSGNASQLAATRAYRGQYGVA